MGELSSARQALEGAEIAPGTEETLSKLTDTSKRPDRLRDPIPREVIEHAPTRPFTLEEDVLFKNLRSAKRGTAGGPGMTVEHLRPLLDNVRDLRLFHSLAEGLAQGAVPETIVDALRLGRLTALRKPCGGVRGIVAGDVVRRLVSRTMAQQLGTVVESATAPYQYALRIRAGCECIAHALQGLCDVDPNATIISIDGIGAFDQISRAAMLEGLMNVEGGGQAIPFVRSFNGSPSSYLWEDSSSITHTIPQGEGGEQGDPLMPLLFSLGQHAALQAIDSDLNDNEFLFAFLDDVYIATTADRVGEVCRCGRRIDKFGHHRASCARAGVLGRRGFALESAIARVCREAGGRVTQNVMVRDLDLAEPQPADGRRLEVVLDGLPLFGGCQLAVDATIVSVLHCDGSPHQGAENIDGVVLERARRRKERTYPELVGPRRRARLVVGHISKWGGAACPLRRDHFCPSWPKLALDRKFHS